MFLYTAGRIRLILLVYVDDIIVTGNSKLAIDQLLSTLATEFALKDLGPLNFFLGIQVTRTPAGILLSQQKYIKDILKKANMQTCKPVRSPSSVQRAPLSSPPVAYSDATMYRQIVGALQYITLTRPNLSFSVNRACQSMHAPTAADWVAVKRILRYFHHTVDFGLSILKSNDPFHLQAFSDSDWAGSQGDRRSTARYAIYMGLNLIIWASRKQKTVACSSTEAEYKSLADTAAEITWLQYLFSELGIFIIQTAGSLV